MHNKNYSDLYDSISRIEEISGSGELFEVLIRVMSVLRSDTGCMWDREQTHDTIKRNVVEEAYEAVDSIEEKDFRGLKEELGDILLQVVFHSQIAVDNNEFNLNDVLKTIISKLVRRHPHVFAGKSVSSSREVLENWEDIKKEERKNKLSDNFSIFANLPKLLPALHYAYEIQTRAARYGFDWENPADVIGKIKEEIAELEKELEKQEKSGISDEAGDLLFSVVNLTRHINIDSEQALKGTCKKFIKRFDFMEKYAADKGLDFKNLTIEEKDKVWEIAKEQLRDN
ncbi:MAG TPA: nucleoside triphosphate pyrophosphohydrolase [Candidatus Humimicrobiaceae bacterium]